MRITQKLSHKDSFTLIELLVVIAILAVLSVAVVFIINPSDIIKQSRDTNRLTDLNNLNKALGIFDVTNPNDFTGTSSIVYTSLPDSSATCANLSLPSLPAGYTYNCATSSTLTKIDGTGWIPINFASTSYGSPIQRLPMDPVNSSTTGEYYSYITGGSWELNAILSSNKYRNDDDITKSNLPGVLSIGTDKTLNPVYTTNGLIAYYKFTEQTGTSTIDSVGAHNGTITPGTGSWTTDNKGNGRAYDHSPTTLITTDSDWIGTSTLSFSGWVYLDSWGDGVGSIFFTNGGPTLFLVNASGAYNFYSDSSTVASTPNGILTLNTWYFVGVTRTAAGVTNFYRNGILVGSANQSSGTPVVGITNVKIGSRDVGNRHIDGRISDFRFYNRVLSAAEVQAIYNATR